MENLLTAWREFLRGKRKRKDVAMFSAHLTDNIIALHHELAQKTYQHGLYQAFKISDPKPRDIHKASVRDRLLHHAIYRILYSCFDRKFIHDSYSCRIGKGTHRAMRRLTQFGRKISRNHTRTAWVLKCDIRKFFANIDHRVLKYILRRHITNGDTLWLLGQVVDSFHAREKPDAGLPLGNLTSQLLVNIYMNELDQFVKRELQVRYYVRYADDFIILHESRAYLENLLPKISVFTQEKLKLSIHPEKTFIQTLASGLDFLGWVHFSHHRVPRTSTKRRMFKKIRKNLRRKTIISYMGLLCHGNTHNLTEKISKEFAHNL